MTHKSIVLSDRENEKGDTDFKSRMDIWIGRWKHSTFSAIQWDIRCIFSLHTMLLISNSCHCHWMNELHWRKYYFFCYIIFVSGNILWNRAIWNFCFEFVCVYMRFIMNYRDCCAYCRGFHVQCCKRLIAFILSN